MSRRRRRPVLLAILAWLTMIGGSAALIGTALVMEHPAYINAMKASPLPYPTAWMFVFQTSFIFCGLFLLKGVGWIRWLYIATAVGVSYLNWGISKPEIVWARCAYFAVTFTVCFLPKANAWFAKVREEGRT